MNSTSTSPPGMALTSHGPSGGNSRSIRARMAVASASTRAGSSGRSSAARSTSAVRLRSAGGPATTRARVSAMRSQVQDCSWW